MTSISKNVCTNKLDNIVNKYKNTYHRTIKMKPADVTSSTYVDFDKENNQEDPKFKADHHVRISNYKNIFAKVSLPNWSEEVFVMKNLSSDATKAHLINTGVGTSDFAKTTDLANLKSDVDKLDINKMKNVPTYLSNWKLK